MENDVINLLANEVVKKLKNNIYSIEDDMKRFLETQINEENKKKALEQLYLFQLYSNAYVGPDPRGQKNIFLDAILVLTAENDADLLNKIEKLKETTEFVKDIETHPLITMKRKLEDTENYEKVIF